MGSGQGGAGSGTGGDWNPRGEGNEEMEICNEQKT